MYNIICNNDRDLNAKQRTSNTFRIHSPVSILYYGLGKLPVRLTHTTRTLYEFGINLYRLRFSINLFTHIHVTYIAGSLCPNKYFKSTFECMDIPTFTLYLRIKIS